MPDMQAGERPGPDARSAAIVGPGYLLSGPVPVGVYLRATLDLLRGRFHLEVGPYRIRWPQGRHWQQDLAARELGAGGTEVWCRLRLRVHPF
jgi:hypothetical protein